MNDQDTAMIMRALAYLIRNLTRFSEDINVMQMDARADELDARRLAGTDTRLQEKEKQTCL